MTKFVRLLSYNIGMNFDNPNEVLEYLTSDSVEYQELSDFAQNLMNEIPELHTNAEGRTFQAITQCILECFKRINNYSNDEQSFKDISFRSIKHL